MIHFYTQVFSDAGPQYDRMAKALWSSAEAHGVNLKINYIPGADAELQGKLHGTYYQNCRKTKHHYELVRQHDTGDIVVLLDADMLVLKPLLPDLEKLMVNKDLAITYRPPSHKFVFNSGFIATRVSPMTRLLHCAWAQQAAAMIQDPRLYRKYASRYGGVNQSALGSLIDVPNSDWAHIRIAELTTLEWNATVLEHPHALKASRIVHLLGNLRRYCLNPYQRPINPVLAPLVAAWEQHANRANDVRELRGLLN